MEKIRIKPCPFCGKEPTITTARRNPKNRMFDFREDDIPQYVVVCRNCNMYFGFLTMRGGIFMTKEDAIEAWNKRDKTGVSRERV